MSPSDAAVILAAGTVLWRPARRDGDVVEVGLVHRPKYDDWSWPKGKADPGEHILACAVREVLEETGHAVTLGQPLPTVRYQVNGADKEVRYWLARADDTAPPWLGTQEIDRLEFVGAQRARGRLSHTHDVTLLDTALTALGDPPTSTSPLIVLRHGKARSRSHWHGTDAERPLDTKGVAQADRLAVLLACYGVTRVVSSDTVRCVDTVRPYATSRRLHVELEPRVSEEGHDANRDGAAEVLAGVLSDPEPVVLCSHRPVLPALWEAAAAAANEPARTALQALPEETLPAGGMVVLHRRFQPAAATTPGTDPEVRAVDDAVVVEAVERHLP